MIASAGSSTLHASATTARRQLLEWSPDHKIGSLTTRFHRDEPLTLGANVGPKLGIASFEDALSGAAGFAQQSDGAAFAVTSEQGAFMIKPVYQQVWARRGLREYSAGQAQAHVEITNVTATPPTVAFSKLRAHEQDARRSGHVRLDPSVGVAAIVGSDWALVDDTVRSVQATRPKQPTYPTKPVDPPNPGGGASSMLLDVTEGLRLAKESARIIQTLPVDDTGSESTKDVRIKAYKTNLAAQARLEQQFGTSDAAALSTLRTADASLEDANWQLAKKPSPDGRFTGVDVPGALADTQRAVDLLDQLLGDLTAQAAA